MQNNVTFMYLIYPELPSHIFITATSSNICLSKATVRLKATVTTEDLVLIAHCMLGSFKCF